QALATVSGDPDLFIDRARALAMQERFEGAISDLDVALAIRPRDPLALKLRADAFLELRRFDEAMADVESALDIAPNDVSVLLVRGHIREAQRLSGS
ncbi:MAG: tetratricopeptide repeat protein, partial [Maricaulaceae bacterium]